MPETKPRDLTTTELELLKAPAQRKSESMPLAVPPGTEVPVHLLNPAADAAAPSGAPTARPPDAAASGVVVAPVRN
jgi:hypothetical protein